MSYMDWCIEGAGNKQQVVKMSWGEESGKHLAIAGQQRDIMLTRSASKQKRHLLWFLVY